MFILLFKRTIDSLRQQRTTWRPRLWQLGRGWAEMTGANHLKKKREKGGRKSEKKKSLDRSFIILVLYNHRPNEYRGLGRFSFSFFLRLFFRSLGYMTHSLSGEKGGGKIIIMKLGSNTSVNTEYGETWRTTHINIHTYRETFFVETFILYNTRHVVVISIKTKLMALSLTGVLLT